jgi:hypothetical protein
MTLPADAISVKPGGEIDQLTISGGVVTQGNNVHSYNVEGGIVHALNIKGDIVANGDNSVAVAVSNDGQTPLNNISAISKKGIAVQIAEGKVTDRTGLSAKGAKGDIVES